jgi:hypothetical protein
VKLVPFANDSSANATSGIVVIRQPPTQCSDPSTCPWGTIEADNEHATPDLVNVLCKSLGFGSGTTAGVASMDLDLIRLNYSSSVTFSLRFRPLIHLKNLIVQLSWIRLQSDIRIVHCLRWLRNRHH